MRSLFYVCLLMGVWVPRASAQGADTLVVDVVGAMRQAVDRSPEVAIETAGRDFAAARATQAQATRFLSQTRLTTGHAFAPGLKGGVLDDPGAPTKEATERLYLDPEVRNDWDNLGPYNEATLDVIQPLWTWGELTGQIRAAEAAVAVEAARVTGKEAEVALRTGELYYSLVLTQDLARLADETGRTLDRARTELNRLLEEGSSDVDQADLFQLQLFEQEYRRRVVEVTEQQALAQAALARLLRVPGTVLRPADAALAPVAFAADSGAVYQAWALRARPEVAQARAGLEARDAQVRVARSDYFPKLYLGGSYRARYAPGRFRQRVPYVSDPYLGTGFRVGLGFQVNLAFAQTRAKVQQATAQREEVRFQGEAARELVQFEAEHAYRQLRIAQAGMTTRQDALQIANEWLRTEQINFDLEIGDVDNLIGAVRAQLQAQADAYVSIHTYNVAVLRLLSATGTLTERLRTGLLFDTTLSD